jgi:hypothetical protein
MVKHRGKSKPALTKQLKNEITTQAEKIKANAPWRKQTSPYQTAWKRNNYAGGENHSPHNNQGIGATLVQGTV